MKRVFIPVLICLFALLPPASALAGPGLDESLAEIGNAAPKTSSFIHCHGRDCRVKKKIGFSGKEWEKVAELFPAGSARAERKSIARAIGLMERYAGRKSGTSDDKGGTFDNAFSPGQMDCEDETLNTGTYLTLLQRKGLLHFHSLAGRAHRGMFLNGWPHRAVQIEERKTKKRYVVDSWFHDNGKPAEIVTFDEWKDGWEPHSTQPVYDRSQWLR